MFVGVELLALGKTLGPAAAVIMFTTFAKPSTVENGPSWEFTFDTPEGLPV
jgi:hypothetical protein